jgi:peptide/nickel transport system ATP-binding protein
LLQNLQQKFGFLILFVTHDMSAAKDLCQEICVIKDGKIIEQGVMQEVLHTPQAEYTKVLIESNFSNRIFRT